MVGIAQGMITTARNSHRARSLALRRPATMSPRTSSSAVETRVKYSVRPIAAQKPGAVRTSM